MTTTSTHAHAHTHTWREFYFSPVIMRNSSSPLCGWCLPKCLPFRWYLMIWVGQLAPCYPLPSPLSLKLTAWRRGNGRRRTSMFADIAEIINYSQDVWKCWSHQPHQRQPVEDARGSVCKCCLGNPLIYNLLSVHPVHQPISMYDIPIGNSYENWYFDRWSRITDLLSLIVDCVSYNMGLLDWICASKDWWYVNDCHKKHCWLLLLLLSICADDIIHIHMDGIGIGIGIGIEAQEVPFINGVCNNLCYNNDQIGLVVRQIGRNISVYSKIKS